MHPDGLNLQVLGFFGGTVDQFHLLPGEPEVNYKVGTKVKARVLYDLHQSSPPRFALSLAEHVLSLSPKHTDESKESSGSTLFDAYPVGCTLDAVEVIRVESERGLITRVSPEVEGFVHVSVTDALSYAFSLLVTCRSPTSQTTMYPPCPPHLAPGKSGPHIRLA